MGIGITEYDKNGKEIVDDFEIDTTGFDVEKVENSAHDIPVEEPVVEKVGDGAHDIPVEEPAVEKVGDGAYDIPVEEPAVEDPVTEEPTVEEPGLEEKCAALVIEPQPDGNIKAHGYVMTNPLDHSNIEEELQVTQENIFNKENVAVLAQQVSFESDPFVNAQILTEILDRAEVNYDRTKNIIIEEEGIKTVYFPNGEMMQIDVEVNDLGDMKFILEAQSPEELRNTLEQIKARDGRDNPMKEGPEQSQTQQNQSRTEMSGMDIGDR